MTVLRSAAQTEVETFSGDSNYPTGGYTQSTNLTRVDEAVAEVDLKGYIAKVKSISSNNSIVVQLNDSDTGSEVGSGTDVSSATITYTAYKL